VRVPAKVNLFLAVRGLRSDGYHELVTVMQTVGLHDELRVGVVGPPGRGHHPAARRRMGVELWTGDTEGLPCVGDNLAVRAAGALGSATGTIEVTAVEADRPVVGTEVRTVIDLRKEIPVAGGMAGGSADAAAALLALNELWGCALDRDALRELAADLGSDVPFCVVGGTALATGRGTALAQVLCRGTFHWVVGTGRRAPVDRGGLPAWDEHCTPSEVEPDAVLAALRSRTPRRSGRRCTTTCRRRRSRCAGAGEDRQALLDAGALGAVLSGSGPTLLALAPSRAAAEALARGRVAASPAPSWPPPRPADRSCAPADARVRPTPPVRTHCAVAVPSVGGGEMASRRPLESKLKVRSLPSQLPARPHA
jgi:4-diphosphocytidyl-2-C-methyl-D-erythritol kinase